MVDVKILLPQNGIGWKCDYICCSKCSESLQTTPKLFRFYDDMDGHYIFTSRKR